MTRAIALRVIADSRGQAMPQPEDLSFDRW